VLTVLYKSSNKPVSYIFIDNSESMIYKDSSNVRNLINKFIDNLKNQNTGNFKIFDFGDRIKKTNIDDYYYKANSGQTNFENIAKFIKESSDNINSAVILTDGNINSGSNALSNFSVLGIPVFTIGFTDTSVFRDISVKSIKHNTNIYKGNKTDITAIIYNYGFAGKSVRVKIYNGNNILDEKIITLSATNIDRVIFNYTPNKSGMSDCKVSVDLLTDESNRFNNEKHFQLNILENKLRVIFISSSPTNDLTVIKNAASSDSNRIISSYININNDIKYSSTPKINIDSADVLFLIGFPAKSSKKSEIDFVANLIKQRRVPFFLLINENTELSRENIFYNLLPFKLSERSNNVITVQAEFSKIDNLFFSDNNSESLSFWNNLPPVQYLNNKYSLNNSANYVAYGTSNNLPTKIPLIIYDNNAGIKSFIIFGENIWKWQLQNSSISKQNFNLFIDNIIKWLALKDNNNSLIINTDKTDYFRNEEITFNAELYDDKMQPVENAEINLELRDKSKSISAVFSPTGNGLYESILNAGLSGSVTFKATYKKNNGSVLTKTGKLFVQSDKVEFSKVGRNKEYLLHIAEQTSGEYFDSENFTDLFLKIKAIVKNHPGEKTIAVTYDLWSNYFSLIFIILLLSIEWFIRKTNHLK
jgi:hypothetical protein